MTSTRIDHLLLGTIDLEIGMAEFEKRTGVRPVFGGVHLNLGTHNALVSLGRGSYLEIIAPQDPSRKLTGPFSRFGKDRLGVFGWAIGTSDLTGVISDLEELDISHSKIIPGSRATPDGDVLRWATTFISIGGNMDVNPFFIQWNVDSLHPSLRTPEGCSLDGIAVGLHGVEGLSSFLKRLSSDIDFKVVDLALNGHLLSVSLDTPRGKIRFD